MSEMKIKTMLFLLDEKDKDSVKKFLDENFAGLFKNTVGNIYSSKSYPIQIYESLDFMSIDIEKDVKYHRLDIYFSDDVDVKGYRFIDGNTSAETDMSQTLGGIELGLLSFLLLVGLDEYISSFLLQ